MCANWTTENSVEELTRGDERELGAMKTKSRFEDRYKEAGEENQ
jgi:hypothetical protein